MSEHLRLIVNPLREEGSLSPVKRALQEIRELRSRLREAENANAAQRAPIAIIGAGMRFPGGVYDAESLWELLISGKDAITEIPSDRWDWRSYFDRNRDAAGSMYAVRGGFLDEIDSFDADFFGIAPREAAMLDPQQRLLHEVAWHALENAGIAPGSLRDDGVSNGNNLRAGIFLGLSNVDYYRAAFADDLRIDAYAGSGNSPSMAAGRLAYTLGVHGPAMTVDTSCSSSLVAVHLAVQSLRSGESDLALAGGVNVILGPQMHIAFSRARMLAPDGRCKTFDAAADGYVRSEGCGVVVLKRLSEALQNRDRVLAVIRGSATNHDGRSGGLTAPSSRAQISLLREAFANARMTADEISLIEAHGTGTSLGDPIEMEALGEVFRKRTSQSGPVYVGSIKTNLGHTEAASGIAGLLKVVSALQHQTIPAHLHFETPSSYIPWSELPFLIPTQLTKWSTNPDHQGRGAGVSSFGFSGSNAHVVLQEFSGYESFAGQPQDSEQIAVLSARTPAALCSAARDLAGSLQSNPDLTIRDVCGTLAQGRTHFAYRAGWAVESREELLQHLTSLSDAALLPSISANSAPSFCFLFTGQGSEQAGMGLELYARSSIFASAVDRLQRELDSSLGVTILDIWANSERYLDRASLVQPALYAYGFALSELWRSWGVEPTCVLGHSLGEYVAATVAGVMTPEDGICLVAARGRLVETLGKSSGMIAVVASSAEIGKMLEAHPDLSIAAVNGPNSVVVSGVLVGLQQFEENLIAAGVRYKRLTTTHGFHSSALDGVLDDFELEASKIAYRVPEVRWISNLTGLSVDSDQPVDARYWRRHLRDTVLFSMGLVTAQATAPTDAPFFYLELGAQPQLLALAAANGVASSQAIASISKSGGRSEWIKLLAAAAQLYASGAALNWSAIFPRSAFRSVDLPGYPFERKRFWYDDGAKPKPDHWQVMEDAASDQSSMVPIGFDTTQIVPRTIAANRWATSLMLASLQELGCFSQSSGTAASSVSFESLISEHGVVPGQIRLVGRWLKWLSKEGILVESRAHGKREFALAEGASLAAPSELWSELESLLVADKPQRDYLANCAAKLLPVIRGKISPLESLFPNGDEALARSLYEDSPVAVYLNRIVAAAVSARARAGVKTAMGYARRLRVLEIGAGTGATSASVLRLLDPKDVLYTFSDVSESFLSRARQRFRAHPMEFGLFDLDRDEDASAAAGRFDVVVIANALHVAKDIHAALKRVLGILQPGGSLVLLETTTELAWSDVSIGMIEGWQHFEDAARSDSPLLPVDRWRLELERAGFKNLFVAPGAHQPTSELGLHVILAHRPLHNTDREEHTDVAEQSLRTLATVVSSESQVQRSELSRQPMQQQASGAELRQEIAAAPNAERFEIALAAILQAVARILCRTELPAKEARLMELGMDSLMAMELRNALQQTFGIEELSTTLMFDFPTADSIAVLMLKEIGYDADGSLHGVVSGSVATLTAENASQERQLTKTIKADSHSDLDEFSDDEIAELLRARLGV